MSINEQSSNGQNSQVNDTRNNFNQKVERLSMLGKTKKVQWDAKRRHRSI